MHDGIRLSIVTANLNQGAYLDQAMRSVLDQAYPDLEYLVFDGGSSDNSVDVIRAHADRLAYWVSQPDRGQSHALNQGLSRATGDVVGWLNADDLYLPGAFARATAAFRDDPNLGLLYGDCLILDERSGQRQPWRGVRPAGLRGLLVDANGIPQPSAFVRRSVLGRTGLLDESMHLAMDYDLWLRMYKYTAVRYVHEPLSIVRDHAGTKTRQQAAGFAREFVRALDHFYAGPDVPIEASALRGQAYARVYYACAEAAAIGERQPVAALGWFARALRHDPRLIGRTPRALARLIRARQA